MSIRRITLINPGGKIFVFHDGVPSRRKQCTPPLGLAYLGASLLRSGYDVAVVDVLAEGYESERFEEPFLYYGLTDDEAIGRVRDSRPDVIGISILFSNIFSEAVRLVQLLKKAFPEVPIVAGGQHPSGAPLETLRHKEFDYVIVGEADLSLPALMDHLSGKTAVETVPGLYYRRDGEVRSNLAGVKTALEGDGWAYYDRRDMGNPDKLDQLPLPAWHLFDMENYWHSGVNLGGGDVVRERYGVMVSTRGCPHTCYFCTSPLLSGFKGYRKRTNEDVIAEIHWLRDAYGIEEIQFLDDNFYVSKSRAKKLLALIADEFPDMYFSVPAGTEVNALDDEIIDLMAAANFYKVHLAIESGDEDIQASKVDKHVNLGAVPRMISRLRENSIEIHGFFMIGFPGESRVQIDRTIELARTLDVDDFYISIVTPLPGTPLYDECVADDLLIDGYDIGQIRYATTSIKLPDTSAEELEKMRRDVWKESFERRRRKLDSITGATRHRAYGKVEDYETAGIRTKL